VMGDLVDGIRSRLVDGPGVAILVGEGMKTLTDAQLASAHFGISLLLGDPMAQNRAGNRLIEVKDERPANPLLARGYATNEAMLLHTDGWDASGLMCLSEPADGGASLFASSSTVHDLLAIEAPDLLHLFYAQWTWDVTILAGSAVPTTLTSPIFSVYRDELSCRYGSSMLRRGTALASEQVAEQRTSLLNLFEQVAHRDGVAGRHSLRRGEALWMNNRRVLHGREPFIDGTAPGTKRRLLRTWVALENMVPLASGFGDFDSQVFGVARLVSTGLSVAPL